MSEKIWKIWVPTVVACTFWWVTFFAICLASETLWDNYDPVVAISCGMGIVGAIIMLILQISLQKSDKHSPKHRMQEKVLNGITSGATAFMAIWVSIGLIVGISIVHFITILIASIATGIVSAARTGKEKRKCGKVGIIAFVLFHALAVFSVILCVIIVCLVLLP